MIGRKKKDPAKLKRTAIRKFQSINESKLITKAIRREANISLLLNPSLEKASGPT